MFSADVQLLDVSYSSHRFIKITRSYAAREYTQPNANHVHTYLFAYTRTSPRCTQTSETRRGETRPALLTRSFREDGPDAFISTAAFDLLFIAIYCVISPVYRVSCSCVNTIATINASRAFNYHSPRADLLVYLWRRCY